MIIYVCNVIRATEFQVELFSLLIKISSKFSIIIIKNFIKFFK